MVGLSEEKGSELLRGRPRSPVQGQCIVAGQTPAASIWLPLQLSTAALGGGGRSAPPTPAWIRLVCRRSGSFVLDACEPKPPGADTFPARLKEMVLVLVLLSCSLSRHSPDVSSPPPPIEAFRLFGETFYAGRTEAPLLSARGVEKYGGGGIVKVRWSADEVQWRRLQSHLREQLGDEGMPEGVFLHAEGAPARGDISAQLAGMDVVFVDEDERVRWVSYDSSLAVIDEASMEMTGWLTCMAGLFSHKRTLAPLPEHSTLQHIHGPQVSETLQALPEPDLALEETLLQLAGGL